MSLLTACFQPDLKYGLYSGSSPVTRSLEAFCPCKHLLSDWLSPKLVFQCLFIDKYILHSYTFHNAYLNDVKSSDKLRNAAKTDIMAPIWNNHDCVYFSQRFLWYPSWYTLYTEPLNDIQIISGQKLHWFNHLVIFTKIRSQFLKNCVVVWFKAQTNLFFAASPTA